jgi:hypothetical protein
MPLNSQSPSASDINSTKSTAPQGIKANHFLSEKVKSESRKKREAKTARAKVIKQLGDGYSLSELGVAIHYLKENSKAPLENGWTTAVVNTPSELVKKYRANLNLGVRLGKPSRIDKRYLYCIDVDIRYEHAAEEAMVKLRSMIPEYDTLPSVVSGSSGASRHYYFLTTIPLVSKKIAHSAEQIKGEDGKLHWKWEIEFFGTGKQTVLPPSVHPVTKKCYVWERRFNFKLMDLGFYPEIPADRVQGWFSKEIDNVPSPSVKPPLEFSETEIDSVLGLLDLSKFCDDREGWLKVGMALHHQYEGADEGYNKWCQFSEQSERFNGADQRRVWESFKGGNATYTFASLIYVTREARTISGFDAIPYDDLGTDETTKLASKQGSTLQFHRPHQIDEIPEAHDFIEGLLFENQISVIYGPPGSGKTFFLLDLAAHVVLGRAWQGSAVDPVPVLYIALEGSSGMKRRRLAWCKRHGIKDPHTLQIHFADGFLDIREGTATRKKIIDYALEHGIKWIVFDTLSRAMAGGEESSSKDMGAVFLGADEIRRLSGAHVTLVHHTGKDQSKGGRGSSLLVGNIDTEIQITREGGNRAARLTKQKEGEDGAQWQFKVEQIDLGYQNKRGKPVSSAVAVVGLVNDFAPADDLSEREKSAFNILVNLISNSEMTNEKGDRFVSTEVFRRSLKSNNWPKIGASQGTFKMALSRVIEALKLCNKILINNNNIGLVT